MQTVPELLVQARGATLTLIITLAMDVGPIAPSAAAAGAAPTVRSPVTTIKEQARIVVSPLHNRVRT